MQVRIFYKNRFLEEALDQRKSLSIGGSSEDDCCVSDCGLVPGHVVFTREGGGWKLSGAGEILAHGKRVREERITHADTYVLNKEHRVAMMVFEPGDEKRIPLPETGSVLRFGRADDNTVVIDSLPISRHHLNITGEGASYYIEDEGSLNGTFINGQSVRGRQKLLDGQTVVLGNVSLKKEGPELIMTLPLGISCRIKNIKPAKPAPSASMPEKEIHYQRSPRLKQNVPAVTVEIESPPDIGGKPEIDWLATLLPAAVTGMITLISCAMNSLLAIPIALVGIIVTINNYKKQVEKYEGRQKARHDKYIEHLNHETEKIEMFDKNDAAHRQKFKADFVSPGRFVTYGKRMRHIVCEEPGKGGSIPKNFSFYEMQKIGDIREWDLMKEYECSDVTKSMGAPIGIIEGDKLQVLDLLENAHGLVAGTTGSGKSEVMLSYLLSLALRFAPTEVSFIIIDFKGGGMADRLEKLPHLAGVITNIDEGEINRSLRSIKAELLRRQRLFAEAEVNSIGNYIRAFKSGRVTDPLPHLIIAVDEFAELRAVNPELMAKLFRIGQIGRSLGIHLILATQKPSGQVSEDIWSNSRFQICLRVASREDSNAVIKSPLAFNIREPGRAYLRVGNNEVFELFQSGYSGVKTADGTTQLDAVINYIAKTCKVNGIERIPAIFLPPLPTVIDAPENPGENLPDGQIAIGIYDDPEMQYQGELFIDPFTVNTFILGAALTGKTNLLQEIIRAVADRYSPEEVNLYILDFSSKVLKIFEQLPQVGGVVTDMEEEKLKNLFVLLNTEIDDRQKCFQELGVSSFNAYMEAGKTDKARIVLIIDNLTALWERYFTDNDLLLPICQNGLAYGISVIVANSQTTVMGYRHMARFANKIALFCNDSGEYSLFFGTHCTMRIPNVAGRCIVKRGMDLYQAQIYRAYAGEKEIEREKNIRQWIAQKKENTSDHAMYVPVIPDILS